MTFLFPAILAGLAAVGIPAVLHLIARQKFPVRPIPTIMLIEPERRTNAHAMRPVDLLQLLLRIIVVAVVVLALARPALIDSTLGRSSRNIVVVLDCSPSMLAKLPDSADDSGGGDAANDGGRYRTLFDRAKETAALLLSSAGPHDRVALIEAGGPGGASASQARLQRSGVRLTADAQSLAGRARLAQAGYESSIADAGATGVAGTGGIGEAIGEACRMLASRREYSSTIYVLSDMRRNILDDWDEQGREALAAARRRLGDRLSLKFLDFAPGDLANLGITDVKLSPGRISPGSNAHLAATIRNVSDEDREVSVDLLVRSTAKTSRTVSVPAGSHAVVDLTTSFDAAMNTFCQIEIPADDALPPDDRYYVPIRMDRQFKVLIVDGTDVDDSPESSLDGTGELSGAVKLEFALNPAQFAASEGRGRTRSSNVERITLGAVSTAMIGTYQLVVLYQVSALPARAMQDIEDLVENGGNLLIIPGEDIDLIDLRNNFTTRGERLRLCPAAVGNAVEVEPGAKVAIGHDVHPVMEPFLDMMKGDLNTLSFKQLYQLQPAEGANVVFSVAGMPAIVEMQAPAGSEQPRGTGRGRICVCAFGLEREWTDLASTRVFVPLVWRLADYLAGRLGPLPVDMMHSGKRIVVDASDFLPAPYVAILGADASPWLGPDGWPLEIPLREAYASATDSSDSRTGAQTGSTIVSGLSHLGPYMLASQGQVEVDVALADGTSVSGTAYTAAVREMLRPGLSADDPAAGPSGSLNVRSPGASVRVESSRLAGDFGSAIMLRGIEITLADGARLEGSIPAGQLDDALAGRVDTIALQTGATTRTISAAESAGGAFARAVSFGAARAVDRKARFLCVNLPAGETDTRPMGADALAASFDGQQCDIVPADTAASSPDAQSAAAAGELWYALAILLLVFYFVEAAVGHLASRRRERSRTA